MITTSILSSDNDLVKKLSEVPFKKKHVRIGHPSTYADDLKLLHELQVQQLEMEMQDETLRTDKLSLEELNKRHNELFEFAPNGYFTMDNEGMILRANHTGADMLGVNKATLAGQLILDFIHPQDKANFETCWFNLLITQDYQVIKVRLSRPDGHHLYVRMALTITQSNNESQILLAMKDFTIVKHIEDAQAFLLGGSWAESGKDFFQALAEYLAKSLGIDCVSIEKLLDGNTEAETVAIYCDGCFKNNIWYRVKDSALSRIMEQKSGCIHCDEHSTFPDDKTFALLNAENQSGVTLWGTQGKPIGMILVIGRKPLVDSHLIEMVLKQVSIRAAAELEHRQLEEAIIKSRDELEVLVKERTAELEKTNKQLRDEIYIRQQHEQSLVEAEEKYRTVSDFTFDWETWLNPDGEFIYVSPSCKRISGYTTDEFMKDPELFVRIAHPDDREKIKAHLIDEQKADSQIFSFDFRINTRNGEELWIAHHCQPVFDSNGKFHGQRGSNRDITQRKIAQNILVESQNHLRQLTKRIDAIAEEQRTMIAREIHDELGHLLTALKYDMDMLVNTSDFSIESIKNELGVMILMVDSLIDSVRRIATELRPGILDHLGLFPAIEWQIRQFQMRTKISCSFNLSEMEVTFDKNETTIIYRILQEILTNITRHSKARNVQVLLTKQAHNFVLKVSDNGIGFAPNDQNKMTSLGLMGMQERALSIGGELHIDSAPDKGTTITFLLPKVENIPAVAELYS